MMTAEQAFISPEQYLSKQPKKFGSTEEKLLIACLDSGKYLADEVVERYRELLDQQGSQGQLTYLDRIEKHFADSETCVELPCNVRGSDVFLFQSRQNPVLDCSADANYLAFLLACRTFRNYRRFYRQDDRHHLGRYD